MPSFAAQLDAEFAVLSDVKQPSTAGYTRVQHDTSLRCGAATIQFDASGAISMLAGEDKRAWANATHTLGRYIYQSFDDDDYQEFLAGPNADTGGPGFGRPECTPNNTRAICGNFNKPRMALGGAKHRELSPSLLSLWQKTAITGQCSFLAEGALPQEAHELAGAPSSVWTAIELSDITQSPELKLEFEYLAFGKTATRLPESLFVQFKPAVPSVSGWELEMFNRTDIVLDPADVMPSPLGSGGAPHTRCVSGVRWSGPSGSAAGGSMHLSSLDVPCIAAGEPTPFPTPRNVAPDMSFGVSYNVYNNIWNTK
jgi:hypothetical protein